MDLENLEKETFTDEIATENDTVLDVNVEELNEEIQEELQEIIKEIPKEVEKKEPIKRKKKADKKEVVEEVQEVFPDTEKEVILETEKKENMKKVDEEVVLETEEKRILNAVDKEKIIEEMKNRNSNNKTYKTSIDATFGLTEMKEVSNKTNKDSKKILNTLAKFTVTQILTSKKYVRHRDFLRSILDAEKTYSHSEVEKIIDDFKKGKVD